jgi:4-hydroxyproline epimerase
MSNPQSIQHLHVIDSHTGGEPTRVVIDGGPELVGETMVEKRHYFERHTDWVRTASVCEPRGHEAVVGAMLCESKHPECVAGVIFFNNVGCISGCVHGTIGVAVTLAHLGRIGAGTHGIETPSGVVYATLSGKNEVTVRNVRSYRYAEKVAVDIPDWGEVVGEIAWGGNWFFLIEAGDQVRVESDNLETLTQFTTAVSRGLVQEGITGADGEEIDHIEVFGPPSDPADADSKNFVLCPGHAYDRSPCGTGTSAKLACLQAAGKLGEGETWRQAGILDTVFEGSVEIALEGGVYPTITGSAFVTAEAKLLINPDDPFTLGIPSTGQS